MSTVSQLMGLSCSWPLNISRVQRWEQLKISGRTEFHLLAKKINSLKKTSFIQKNQISHYKKKEQSLHFFHFFANHLEWHQRSIFVGVSSSYRMGDSGARKPLKTSKREHRSITRRGDHSDSFWAESNILVRPFGMNQPSNRIMKHLHNNK